MYIGRVQIFQVFHSKQFFSWLGRFIYKLGYSNFESTYKKPPFIKVVIFSDVILVSSYPGCKEESLNLIPHYLVDIIHKIVKPSHLEKLQIIQNINKLMFQVIFIFFDWILRKKIIVSSTHYVLGETDFQKILPGVLNGGLGH